MDTGAKFNSPVDSTDLVKKFTDKQAWFQQRQAKIGFAHLIGKGDRITSVAIPLAMGIIGGGMAIRALHNMYTGTGKNDL